MNPWMITLNFIGWTLLVLLVLALLLLLGGLLAYGVRWARGLAKRKHTSKPKHVPEESQPTGEDLYLLAATVAGADLYGTSPNPSLEAFRAGARWGWSRNHGDK